MTKTNKSFLKRIKLTRTGKLTARKGGQNHFNAKESGQEKLRKKGQITLNLSNKIRGRFFQD